MRISTVVAFLVLCQGLVLPTTAITQPVPGVWNNAEMNKYKANMELLQKFQADVQETKAEDDRQIQEAAAVQAEIEKLKSDMAMMENEKQKQDKFAEQLKTEQLSYQKSLKEASQQLPAMLPKMKSLLGENDAVKNVFKVATQQKGNMENILHDMERVRAELDKN